MATRIIEGQNRDWRFRFGSQPADRRADQADDGWLDVGLPHSFAVPADLDTTFYVGAGSYQHDLEIPESWKGKRIALRFGGVFQHLAAFLDGRPVGSHAGGYSEFELDLTRWAMPGRHLLHLEVDNEWDAELPPRAGEHVFNGGVYRDVSLVVTDLVHIAPYGVAVSTPSVSADRATVVVTVAMENDSAIEQSVEVRCTIEHRGSTQRASTRIDLPAVGRGTASVSFEIEQPELWHPDDPVLHAVTAELLRDDLVLDEDNDEFGLRWFEFTADRGFFLNGEHLWLEGANVHQDHAGWGDGVTHAAIARDVALIKAAGMNFIRGSHYPHHEQFARECDRQGVLFWSEAPFWGTGGETVEGFWTASAYPIHQEQEERFERNVLASLETMIRTNFNRPSIIAWSMGNEVYFSEPEVLEKARTLTSRMVARSRELDPGRPAAVGGAQRGNLDVLGDVAGYNGDGAALYPDPGFPNMVTEYGSVVEDRPGESLARYTDGTEVPHSWRSGVALWCAFHHGSIFAGMSHMGFIDHRRLPLRSYFWYRERLTGEPAPAPSTTAPAAALSIQSDRPTIRTDGTDDARLIVSVLDGSSSRTRAPLEVQLRVLEGDGRFPTGREHRMVADDDSLLDGLGAVDLRAYFAGPIRVVATAPGLPDAELLIEAIGGPQWDDRPLRFPSGPPTRSGVPRTADSANLAARRPVFASGTAPSRSAAWVTDPNTAAGWTAPDQTPGHWLIVDLEGPRRLNTISVGALGSAPVTISTSPALRHEGYEAVGTDRVDELSQLRMVFPEREARYIRIEFPESPLEVLTVAAFEDRS
ncbi:glycoside hydrolase family 2 TIM barrel-domain containing protein [Amnibacterium setariae]|uniref:glycoside hydrolase family 2 TIM barrel-domain containing protein n=1 Tax=Amnibacterium setariae TaxID=2306585 RepID=UPI001313FFCF|nr:glycoside hydrolase family 2 TIM barrel-domain containing protein [Amnibacterium setariae]